MTAVLRGATVGTPTTGISAVDTAAGTLAGDTVFAVQAVNFVDVTDMTGPTATGIEFDSVLRRVKYGNALVGVWRGEVATDGVKTINLPQNGKASSNFPACLTYAGEHVVDAGPVDAGAATGGGGGHQVTLPSITTTAAGVDLVGVWSVISFTGQHAGQMIELPAGMNRVQVPHYTDNAMELVIGRETLGAAGASGTRTGRARTAADADMTGHVGMAGIMLAIRAVTQDPPPPSGQNGRGFVPILLGL